MVCALVVDRRGSHVNEFRECLKNWLIHEQLQTQVMVDACLLLLDKDYLFALPLPPGVILPESPGPRNYRFLFRRHVARLLGWTERRGEGEPHGFSDSVNKFIREVWWPDEVAEALHRAGQQNRQSCGASDPHVLAPASVEIPGSDETPAPEVLLRSDGVQDEVLGEPFQPRLLSVPRGHVPHQLDSLTLRISEPSLAVEDFQAMLVLVSSCHAGPGVIEQCWSWCHPAMLVQVSSLAVEDFQASSRSQGPRNLQNMQVPGPAFRMRNPIVVEHGEMSDGARRVRMCRYSCIIVLKMRVVIDRCMWTPIAVQQNLVPGGVDLGEESVELGSDMTSVRESRQRPEVLIDQHFVLRNTNFHAGRSVRQRLEMSAGGTVVVEQTVDGLPTSTTSREGGSHRSEVPTVTKKSARKRRNPHLSGGRNTSGDALGDTSGLCYL